MTDNDQKGWQFGIDGGAKQWLPYWNIGSFFTQFLLGSLAALVIAHLRSKQTKANLGFDFGFLLATASAILLVLVRLIPGAPDSVTQQPYVSPYFALLMAVALICVSHSVYTTKLLDNRLLAWIAKLSFGIYLWHFVVIEIIARKFVASYVYSGMEDAGQWILISSMVLIISIAIAAASWRWLESPILKSAHRANAKQKQSAVEI